MAAAARMGALRALALLSMITVAFAGCSVGDTPCWCKSIGGEWIDQKEPLMAACRINYKHDGEGASKLMSSD
jgi:hypothetical protein